jgi:phenylpropionate dioxygenase-like ring-hydroxylating dioxygenase large terminal subunit
MCRLARGIFRGAMIDDPVLVNDWHVVARSNDLAAGQVRATRLLGQDVVLWREVARPRAGFIAEDKPAEIHAWRDLCLHRGAKLSGGRVIPREDRASAPSDCLACPYHGWEYDASGQCARIPAQPSLPPPAKAKVETYKAQDKYGFVWVCLGEPRADVPEFPEWGDVAFRKVDAGPYVFRAQGPRVIENFLDVGHFPFVHAGLLGDAKHTEVGDYQVESADDGVTAKDIPFFQPDPDGTGWGAEVRYTYRALRPLAAYFVKVNGEKRFAMINFVTPVDDSESVSWAIMALNYAPETTDDALREFQDKVAAQDVPIVESQRPELLPLDLQAELHLRSDRTAIAYRQWLRKIGLRYGTA